MAVSDEIMLKVENVSKVYKLGEIGGTTLRDELQRLGAKLRHKEDPTKKIGAKNYNKGEKFKALDNVSFEVKKGERIGIIGHNGAGKSTLLKLISRVTGPTEGNIYMNGRVASMLEVGTGFHPELTGRENIYMNGAILGMTKKEIDSKIEDIIEFSEVRQFIDTPVKRYSSGMYVKLAFSVAAHLDSEIVIMDEVLAVGDIDFQKKCLRKMKDISINEDRTVLYVSHNMNTIRNLCNRVLVLEKGKIVYDGDVNEGVGVYSLRDRPKSIYEYHSKIHAIWKLDDVEIKSLRIFNNTKENNFIGVLSISSKINVSECKIRFEISNSSSVKIGSSISSFFDLKPGINFINFCFKTYSFSKGLYSFDIVLVANKEDGTEICVDGVYPGFTIQQNNDFDDRINWNNDYWGDLRIGEISILNK